MESHGGFKIIIKNYLFIGYFYLTAYTRNVNTNNNQRIFDADEDDQEGDNNSVLTTLTTSNKLNAQAHSNRLYAQGLQGQTFMQSIVDDWIEMCKKDKDGVMCEFIKFVILCSGCKASSSSSVRTDKELLRTKEFTQFINDSVDCFDNANEELATTAEDTSHHQQKSGAAYPLV